MAFHNVTHAPTETRATGQLACYTLVLLSVDSSLASASAAMSRGEAPPSPQAGPLTDVKWPRLAPLVVACAALKDAPLGIWPADAACAGATGTALVSRADHEGFPLVLWCPNPTARLCSHTHAGKCSLPAPPPQLAPPLLPPLRQPVPHHPAPEQCLLSSLPPLGQPPLFPAPLLRWR
jgi:hypothetical protein